MKRTLGLITAVAAVGMVLAGGGAAYADTISTAGGSGSTVNLTVNATADGSPGITTGASFNPAAVALGGATTMQMGTDTPANICRTTGTCAPGYPDNGALLTITGLAAAGMTFTGNGDTSAGCVQTDSDTVKCNYPSFNNFHKSDHFNFTINPQATPGAYTINVALHVFSKALPTSKSQCKDGGWAGFNDALDNPDFKNQGDCVSYVATGGNS